MKVKVKKEKTISTSKKKVLVRMDLVEEGDVFEGCLLPGLKIPNLMQTLQIDFYTHET